METILEYLIDRKELATAELKMYMDDAKLPLLDQSWKDHNSLIICKRAVLAEIENIIAKIERLNR